VAEGWIEVVGKRVLIGLTYVDADGDVVGRAQKHGVVVSADDQVVRVRLADSEEFTLPPDLEAFEVAAEGEYHLKETGEVIVDPDFITTWTIHTPPED
jgi:hypothetical protein